MIETETKRERHCIRCASILSSDQQLLCLACRAAEEIKEVRVKMSAGELVTYDGPKQHQQIYLAFPYSHCDVAVRQKRFSDCLLMADRLMTRTGFPVFAPIVYGHRFVELRRPGDFATWKSLNLTMLASWASVLIVGTAEGWTKSRGVAAEIEVAINYGKPTLLVDPHLNNFSAWSFK